MGNLILLIGLPVFRTHTSLAVRYEHNLKLSHKNVDAIISPPIFFASSKPCRHDALSYPKVDECA